MRAKLFTLFIILSPLLAMAQPVNDECVNAIMLTEVVNWCSEPAAYSNIDATVSAGDNPFCFPNNTANKDVWFAFVAEANTVNVSVIGGVTNNPGGNQQNPQMVIYSGTCENRIDIGCASDATNNDQVNVFAGPLTIGETYYIRVSARFAFEGTFQLCINNYNEVPAPSGDCDPGVILCDKSPFTVGQLLGTGNVVDDLGSVCDQQCQNPFTESGSTWYKWTCDQSGSLEFTLNPLNPTDDIDFAVYELPNGLDDCSGKIALRCMLSGENTGSPLSEWIACTGATGMVVGDPDTGESCGCQTGDNNYISAINMVSGRSYAIIINNYSQSGSGFSIEFGGSGTFLGPTADFQSEPVNEVCVGDPVTYTDASFYVGNIENYSWTFGPHATPSSAQGIGPHQVVYDQAGLQTVVLTVESERGCLVTKVKSTVEVVCCAGHFSESATLGDEQCAGDETGSISLNITSPYGPNQYVWEDGSNSDMLTGLGQGNYSVTVTDQALCQTVQTFIVSGPDSIRVDMSITMPTCDGGTDGAVALTTTGGTSPYEYNWQNMGFSPDNTLSNLVHGDYSVTIKDDHNCELALTIPVHELELLLDPSTQAITDPSCTDFSDGEAVIDVVNGLPPYQYDWNDGNGFINTNLQTGLTEGVYSVDVLDANRCKGHFDLELVDPLPLMINFETENVHCFGESNGMLNAQVSGGTGDYVYQWSTNANTEAITQLPIGDYTLTVTDENDCLLSETMTITQPPELFINPGDIIDNICFDYSDGQINVLGMGGTPPYEYSIDGEVFQVSTNFSNLHAGTYTLSILDVNGCDDITEATVEQPEELIVDAGPDQTIELGYETTGMAIANEFPVNFSWSPLDSLHCLNADCDHIGLNPTSTTTYTVTVVNDSLCFATDEMIIHVIKNRPIYPPNAFSPNNDGINDLYTIFSGPAVREIQLLQIYDRWGELVFEAKNIPTNDISLGWDGTFRGQLMKPAVFTFYAQVLFIDGEVEVVKGDITLIR